MSGLVSRAVAAVNSTLEGMRATGRRVDVTLLWFLIAASVSSIVLRFVEEFVFGTPESESAAAEWGAIGAFVTGLLLVANTRKTTKAKSKWNKQPKSTEALRQPRDHFNAKRPSNEARAAAARAVSPGVESKRNVEDVFEPRRPDARGEGRGDSDAEVKGLSLDHCSQHNRAQRAEEWFAQMQEAGACPVADCYTTVIKAHTRAGDIQGATRWLNMARDAGEKPDASAYNAVIMTSARACKPKLAERVLLQMLRDEVLPDTLSFNSVINAYAKGEEVDAMGPDRIVRLMCEHNVEPDVVTLGAAVHACAGVGDKERAEAIFNRIVSRGKFVPDAICYNALINTAVKARDIAAAEQWLEKMLKDGVTPNVVSFTTVLHAHARTGNIEAAERGMELMRSYGVAPNVVSYSALIHACCKVADVDRAEMWFNEMRTASIKANVVSYSVLLDVCAKAGDWSRAEHWLVTMIADGVMPNIVCFNNVIDACAKGSNALRAEAWLRRLLREESKHSVSKLPYVEVPVDVVVTRQTFTAAASAYASTGCYVDVERILSQNGYG